MTRGRRGRRPTLRAPAVAGRRLALRVVGDRGDLEALQLEIRRLARAQGVELDEMRIARVERRRARRSG